MATFVLNYSQVTLTALEMSHFPSVNIPLFATVYYLTGQYSGSCSWHPSDLNNVTF